MNIHNNKTPNKNENVVFKLSRSSPFLENLKTRKRYNLQNLKTRKSESAKFESHQFRGLVLLFDKMCFAISALYANIKCGCFAMSFLLQKE